MSYYSFTKSYPWMQKFLIEYEYSGNAFQQPSQSLDCIDNLCSELKKEVYMNKT